MSLITQGQSLADVAIQELGSVAGLFDLADANGLAITDTLTAGQLLTVPASANGRPEVAALFAARGARVNAGADITVFEVITAAAFVLFAGTPADLCAA